MVPTRYLDPVIWQGLPVDVLHVAYDDGYISPGSTEPDAIYQPVARIPVVVLVRTSDSEKRLESKLAPVLLKEGDWGSVFEVQGAGAPLGLCIVVKAGVFCGAHPLPDMVHLVACEEELPADSIVKGLYETQKIKVFLMGPIEGNDRPHDLLVTTKTRWFRNRNNPKFLGFSKDDKP